MAISIPQLDIYYIEFAKKDYEPKNDKINKVLKESKLAVSLSSLLLSGVMPLSFAMFHLINMGLSITPDMIRSLKRLIDENSFFIIKSEEELKAFENPLGNDWVINSKKLKQKQYYVRHPKKENRNILIEAKDFYKYIEDEQRNELLEFILLNCPAKRILIDRVEIVKASGKGKGNVEGLDVYAGASGENIRGNYFEITNPKRPENLPVKENYYWLDKSLMRGIQALSEGSSLSDKYENDFTFGLKVGEAKTIGLDMNMHKKYRYLIRIEC